MLTYYSHKKLYIDSFVFISNDFFESSGFLQYTFVLCTFKLYKFPGSCSVFDVLFIDKLSGINCQILTLNLHVYIAIYSIFISFIVSSNIRCFIPHKSDIMRIHSRNQCCSSPLTEWRVWSPTHLTGSSKHLYPIIYRVTQRSNYSLVR